MQSFVIAIDGHAGAGKGTIAQDLVHRLADTHHLDTGAMYRAWSYFFLRTNDPVLIARRHLLSELQGIDLNLAPTNGRKALVPRLEGKLLGDTELRNEEVTKLVPHIAQIPQIREHVAELQREARQRYRLVVDGRDIGTEIFPDAEVKFFVTASLQERAWRRKKELEAQGKEIALEVLMKDIGTRDYMDETREKSPLKPHPDAIRIDTTHLNREAQFEEALRYVRARIGDIVTL